MKVLWNIFWFLSYLWGMETPVCQHISLLTVHVLILPMRNGNIMKQWLSLWYLTFLSYLWGMETRFRKCDWATYETARFLSYLWGMETSQTFLGAVHQKPCSYPTYEEWKLSLILLMLERCDSSYPTYEEWKLFVIGTRALFLPRVLILPMRNGNL